MVSLTFTASQRISREKMNVAERDQVPVNYASQSCKSMKQVQNIGHASNPDHGHASDANPGHYSRIACDQPLMKQEPVIVHARDPRIIHTDPDNFMLLVQSLTGSCTTRTALCKQLENQRHGKRKRNHNTCGTASTDEVQYIETVIDDLTVNDRFMQQQKVKQQQKKKQQKNDKNMSIMRPADEQVQRCSQLIHAADHPIQSSHLPAHVTHESPSSSMDSHQTFAEPPSLATDHLSSSPSQRLQDEGSVVSSPNISINYDTPFSKSWSMFTESINSSPVMLPSFHGDQHDDVKNLVCWPLDEDDAAVISDDGDLGFNHRVELASAKNEGFNTEDQYADYIYESSLISNPPFIDFNASSLCRIMPEILDIDSLFACAAEQIVQ